MENTGPEPALKSSVRLLSPTCHRELATTATSSLVITANLEASRSLEQGLIELGLALNLPSWYGKNLDALFDCLSDPEWLPGKTITLFIQGTEHFRHKNADSLANLIETFVAITEARNATQLPPLLVIIDGPAPDASQLPPR